MWGLPCNSRVAPWFGFCGCAIAKDVFFHPWEGHLNAGYILVDLDHAEDNILDSMPAHGHAPCVVLGPSGKLRISGMPSPTTGQVDMLEPCTILLR